MGRSEYVQESFDMDTRAPRWFGKGGQVQERIDNDGQPPASHNESVREPERHSDAGWE